MTPDWSRIDTVLLDMDGTLLDLHFDNYFWLDLVPRQYAAAHALDLEEARQNLSDHYQRIRGQLNWYCLDYWQRELDLDIVALKKTIVHKIAARRGTEEFLGLVQRNGKRLLLVTNAHPASLELKLDATGIDRYFDVILSAHQLGHAKEEQAFWQRLCAEQAIDPLASLFIDDSTEVLASARRFGIGQLCGIHKPDSARGEQYPEGFDSVDSLLELVPDAWRATDNPGT